MRACISPVVWVVALLGCGCGAPPWETKGKTNEKQPSVQPTPQSIIPTDQPWIKPNSIPAERTLADLILDLKSDNPHTAQTAATEVGRRGTKARAAVPYLVAIFQPEGIVLPLPGGGTMEVPKEMGRVQPDGTVSVDINRIETFRKQQEERDRKWEGANLAAIDALGSIGPDAKEAAPQLTKAIGIWIIRSGAFDINKILSESDLYKPTSRQASSAIRTESEGPTSFLRNEILLTRRAAHAARALGRVQTAQPNALISVTLGAEDWKKTSQPWTRHLRVQALTKLASGKEPSVEESNSLGPGLKLLTELPPGVAGSDQQRTHLIRRSLDLATAALELSEEKGLLLVSAAESLARLKPADSEKYRSLLSDLGKSESKIVYEDAQRAIEQLNQK